MNTINPLELSEYITAFGFSPDTADQWKDNLNKNKCKFARIFLPVKWTGK